MAGHKNNRKRKARARNSSATTTTTTTTTTGSTSRGGNAARRSTPAARSSAPSRRNNNVEPNVTTKLPQKCYDKYPEGIKKAAKELGIKSYQKDPVYKYEGEESTRGGSKGIEDETKRSYESKMKQLWNFAVMLGYYDSLFILMSPAPDGCLPTSAELLCLFIKYKRQIKGTPLKAIDGRTQVKDIFGRNVKADGNWNNPKLVTQFASCLLMVHTENEHLGNYQDQCKACCNKRIQCRKQSHRNDPHLARKGNPTTQKDFVNIKKSFGKQAGYKENGCKQLLPMHLRSLSKSLLGNRTLGGLQMWVQILIACRNFLRHDEFHTMSDEDILMELHEISDWGIDGLGFEVMGKADKDFVQLMMWADDECPDLCPVRNLLVYLFLINYKKGYLFPAEEELYDPPADGHCNKDVCPHSTFCEQFKKICHDALPKNQDGTPIRVGASTFRKTGYLLAAFGKGQWQDAMSSARHTSVKNAQKYFLDAASIFERHRLNGTHHNEIGKFKGALVLSPTNARDVSAGRLKQIEFKDLPTYFVRHFLKVQEGHPLERDMDYLFEQAKKYRTNLSPRERLRKMLEKLPADEKEDFQRTINLVIAEDVAENTPAPAPTTDATTTEATTTEATTADTTNNDTNTGTAEEEEVVDERPAKRARTEEGKVDLPGRLDLKKKKTTAEKIALLLEIEKEVPESPSTELNKSAKKFYYLTVKPILGCLHHHHKDDVDAFCAANPDLKHTSYKQNKCGGEGPICKPCEGKK